MLKIRAMLIILLLAVLARPAPAQKRVSASEAKDHVSEVATVCGEVASTHYSPSTKGQPTFLNLDKPYPNPIFTILIWAATGASFGVPENEFKGKRVCVTGKISAYRGAPEIVANAPGQIKIDSR